ncbi:UNVERIFIED_CONTAM: hypothetical protein RF648_21340, partial [Kocuria sp. CPCC 205274]
MTTSIKKRDFINNLDQYVGKKFKLMAGQYHIGIVSVELSDLAGYRHKVTVEYVGNYRKRIERNSFKANCHINSFACNRSWDRLHYADKEIFSWRTLVEIKEKEVSEVKQVDSVIIKRPKKEKKVFFLRHVPKGTPFWYNQALYHRTNSDTHNALRLVDG